MKNQSLNYGGSIMIEKTHISYRSIMDSIQLRIIAIKMSF